MIPWKNQKAIPAFSVFVLCGVMTLAYQNCARAKFTIDPGLKAEALGKEGVFGREPGDDGSVGGGRPGDDSNTPGGGRPGDDAGTPGKRPPGNDPGMPGGRPPGNDPSMPSGPVSGNDPAVPGGLNVVFRFVCSNVQTEANAGNLLTSQSVKLVIAPVNGMAASCELTGDFKNDILNKKQISFKPCANLAPGSYRVYAVDSAVSSSDMAAVQNKSLTDYDIAFRVNSDSSITYTGRTKVEILYDLNKNNSLYGDLKNQFGNSTDATQAACDTRVSPLIISMNSQARGIKLTSPMDGIQFDILGERSFPRAHDKKQISWLTREEQEYYFITLPNKDGQVSGINELFGDNTRGPDGKFAANGYKALEKYDDDRDKLITDQDEVFEKLRLWGDANRDGIAQSDELLPLKEKAISVIDLHYDKRYKETDQYGNQTLMKSVVKTEDGKLHLVFDLWFRYLNITK
ncbi:hypothetical protein [Bdellovibrio sp. HCB337]|uniref:hypothetical protein n=1 Tax=Bdellovibrio sp. HCB337 TaxID=3394358 RepID=UPI0039A6337A